jgi:murein hydrolase activator
VPERRAAAAALVALGIALGSAPAQAESLPQRLARLEARIAALEALSRELAPASAEPELSHADGAESLRSQDLLRERRGEAESELAQANAETRDAERRLRELVEAMSERLVVMYKTRRAGALPAFSSARDLQSGLRLASDLGRVLESDARVFEQYRRRLEELRSSTARSRALSLRVEEAELAYERQRRIDARNALELQRLRARRSLRLAAELRDVARRLEAQPPAGSSTLSPPRQGALPRPVAGPLRARFGARLIAGLNAVPRRSGVEIEAPRGAAVRAVAPGRVSSPMPCGATDSS